MRAPARIGYVLWKFPKLSETFVVEELHALAAAGVEPVIFARTDPAEAVRNPRGEALRPRARWLDRMGRRQRCAAVLAVVGRHPVRVAAVTGHALRQRSRVSLANLWWGLVLARVAAREGIGLLHAHFADVAGEMAWFACRVTGIRLGLTLHAVDIYLARFLCRQLRDAALVVTVCRYNVEQITRRCPDVDRGSVLVKYAGVDPDAFRLASGSRRAVPPLVLAVGRLVDKKGFPALVSAAALLQERGVPFACRIIGDGPQRPALAARIAAAGLGGVVELAGELPPEQIRGELARATVLAAPCTVAPSGDRDSMPVVIKEAMAMRLPVVASDDFGIPEMVDADCGILVPRDDPVGLADGLQRILSLPPEELERMGDAGRRRVEARFGERPGALRLAEAFARLGA